MHFSKFIISILAIATILSSCNKVPRTGKMEFKNSIDSVSYALGFIEAKQFVKGFERLPFDLDSMGKVDLAKVYAKTQMRSTYKKFRTEQFDTLNEEAFYKGFLNELVYGKGYFNDMTADIYLRKIFTQKREQKDSLRKVEAEANLKKGQEFLAKNKEQEGVQTTESGLQYKVLKKGNGPIPGDKDKVRCVYHGTLIDGTVFDSSLERKDTTSFRVNGVIKGWTEALKMMPQGSKYKLYIPSELAYGKRDQGAKIKANSVLLFDLELIEVVPAKKKK
ncbi:FKBP-type peptidyl-prolyl cis-trans isomerase [Prolixibacteraceae bacterium JC049]|nr:FKBP-type peptidyl-prolyl cis-trans isomerase [Prolixibacteraceae bacterium JC049]